MHSLCCLVILATFFAGNSYAREHPMRRGAHSDARNDKTRKMIGYPLIFEPPEDMVEEPNIRDLIDRAEKAIKFIHKVYIRLIKRIINGLMGYVRNRFDKQLILTGISERSGDEEMCNEYSGTIKKVIKIVKSFSEELHDEVMKMIDTVSNWLLTKIPSTENPEETAVEE
ncbi:hypothetical protein L9F63_018955 [Diploptera punctata]|uniref:Uncharacterized protein n=1 Tax=Diploptera punctata TaxID=6984 RepID=A0AAD7ZVE4_DIPPU|nr:hypothetical protein L9F63_018955 [Diploptera punctata]